MEHTHPDLVNNYDAADSWDFGNNDPDPAPYYAFDDHGTSVAGIAAAQGNNGIGVSGTAPNASLAGLRLDFLTDTDAMEAAPCRTIRTPSAFTTTVGARPTPPPG